MKVLVATSTPARFPEPALFVVTSTGARAHERKAVFAMTSAATDPQQQEPESAVGQREVLERVRAAADRVREIDVQRRQAIDDRNAAILEAVDLYRCSHRQVAAWAGLSIGRVEGVLAND